MSANKDSIFKMLCLVVLVGLVSCNKEEEFQKPNFLFIAVDDLRPDLGCYGNNVVISPNLDKLASRGTVFLNHFVSVPTCGASRHSLLTGLRPQTRAHLTNNITELSLSGQSEDTIPETFIHQLRRNGYHTIGIGKISHSADGFLYGYNEPVSNKRELPHSWDELIFDHGKWATGWNAFFGLANGENRQSLNNQIKPYEKGAVTDTGYVDGLTTKLAISKLKELKANNKPFFMGVGFFKPHLPFNSPEKYWELYNRDSIPASSNPLIPTNVHKQSLHNSAEFNRYALGDERAGLDSPVSEDYTKKLRHAYYACISYIDHQIGLIINELESLGLSENTIVIVWGDHGWHLGDQQVWGKHTIFENALKSTLIIKHPDYPNAQTVSSIVEAIDIYPTIMDLSQIEISHKIDGESFSDMLKGKDIPWNNLAYGYYRQGISLRTSQFRLTKYFRDEEPVIELYDHESDALESINVALEYPEVVNRLLPILEKGNTMLYK